VLFEWHSAIFSSEIDGFDAPTVQLKLMAHDIVELQIAEDQLNLTNLRQILLVDGIV